MKKANVDEDGMKVGVEVVGGRIRVSLNLDKRLGVTLQRNCDRHLASTSGSRQTFNAHLSRSHHAHHDPVDTTIPTLPF
jgi:hypothetical protein